MSVLEVSRVVRNVNGREWFRRVQLGKPITDEGQLLLEQLPRPVGLQRDLVRASDNLGKYRLGKYRLPIARGSLLTLPDLKGKERFKELFAGDQLMSAASNAFDVLHCDVDGLQPTDNIRAVSSNQKRHRADFKIVGQFHGAPRLSVHVRHRFTARCHRHKLFRQVLDGPKVRLKQQQHPHALNDFLVAPDFARELEGVCGSLLLDFNRAVSLAVGLSDADHGRNKQRSDRANSLNPRRQFGACEVRRETKLIHKESSLLSTSKYARRPMVTGRMSVKILLSDCRDVLVEVSAA